jgi:hypothetical protein
LLFAKHVEGLPLRGIGQSKPRKLPANSHECDESAVPLLTSTALEAFAVGLKRLRRVAHIFDSASAVHEAFDALLEAELVKPPPHVVVPECAAAWELRGQEHLGTVVLRRHGSQETLGVLALRIPPDEGEADEAFWIVDVDGDAEEVDEDEARCAIARWRFHSSRRAAEALVRSVGSVAEEAVHTLRRSEARDEGMEEGVEGQHG